MLEKLDKLATREKLGLLIAVVCVFGVLVDQIVAKAIVRKVEQLNTGIEAAMRDRDYCRRLLARENDLKSRYDAISGFLTKSASPSEAVAVMKGEIYDLAKQTGVTINTMDQRETRSMSSCEEYMIEITKFDADMSNLIKFLHRVTAAPGMMRVVRLNIVPGKTVNLASGSMLLGKVMIVEGVRQPPPVKAATSGATTPSAKR